MACACAFVRLHEQPIRCFVSNDISVAEPLYQDPQVCGLGIFCEQTNKQTPTLMLIRARSFSVVRLDNVMYGFDPHDDSDYLTIHGNDVWGNGERFFFFLLRGYPSTLVTSKLAPETSVLNGSIASFQKVRYGEFFLYCDAHGRYHCTSRQAASAW